ncbi:MAG: tRNA lysidine(34) synthetase TilS [Clostridiales bacterium]|nr:tRNA lysidine(34) synthetase TilS [Clostridiales bacterium]
MNIDLTTLVKPNQTVAVALSGGSDSMALLHYMKSNAEKFPFTLIALNVEHGIRGQDSKLDTAFVKDFCDKANIPVLLYEVDCVKKAENEGLSLEQSARILRYECFYNAIESGKCDLVATAHHADDNTESVLFNLFRGTGMKGVSGIKQNFENKIIRPFLSIDKYEIEQYVKANNIPFVTDQTNFCDDYTRNFLRLNVIPKIKEVFPEANKSIRRFCEIAIDEDEFLDELAKSSLSIEKDAIKIPLPLHKALLSRAVIIALKELGLSKDWEKIHVDGIKELSLLNNGSKFSLPKGITAIKEYDAIVLYKEHLTDCTPKEFKIGENSFGNKILIAKVVDKNSVNLKDGFYLDADKIPSTAVIRTKQEGDLFTKFGGGTKSLGDYFTDKKIPLRNRASIPLIANGNEILYIFDVAISDNVKVDDTTSTIIKLYQK